MTDVETIARKWGDSIAVIIPKEVVQQEHIMPSDILHLQVHKEYDLSNVFGKFRTKKTPQELKDESRKAWH